MARELMTLGKLKEIVADRGGRIVLLDDGTPAIRGMSRENATPALFRVLMYFRDEIINDLKGTVDDENGASGRGDLSSSAQSAMPKP